MKIRIYHPHTHAGRAYNPGPDGEEIEVTPAAAKFIRARGLDQPPTLPAIGTEPVAAGKGGERRDPPAARTGADPIDPAGTLAAGSTRHAPVPNAGSKK